jgi:hypothetical protein
LLLQAFTVWNPRLPVDVRRDIGGGSQADLVLHQTVKLVNSFGEASMEPKNLKLRLSRAETVQFQLCKPDQSFPTLSVKKI